jgi:hypothetical protein
MTRITSSSEGHRITMRPHECTRQPHGVEVYCCGSLNGYGKLKAFSFDIDITFCPWCAQDLRSVPLGYKGMTSSNPEQIAGTGGAVVE